MFGLNESTQYYVCQRYVRMNMGINGLYQIVRTEMEVKRQNSFYCTYFLQAIVIRSAPICPWIVTV